MSINSLTGRGLAARSLNLGHSGPFRQGDQKWF